MKKLVKYTVWFWYEDKYWDTADDDIDSGSDHMDYFIEEHNCHTNFINALQRSMDLAGDDICQAGKAEVVTMHPDDIVPYKITIKETK